MKNLRQMKQADIDLIESEKIMIDEAEKQSQVEVVFRHLLSGRQITQTYASDVYGVGRLAARISDIRRILKDRDIYQGWRIITHRVRDGRKVFGSYELVRVSS